MTILTQTQLEYNRAAQEKLRRARGTPSSQELREGRASQFLLNAARIHGTKYDYGAVVYTSASAKVNIICPQHGAFEQTPDAHIRGQGCPVCAHFVRIASRVRLTRNDVVQRAVEIHGTLYEYDEFQYVALKTKSAIRCREHGIFNQTPQAHIRQRQGCPTCADVRRNKFTESKGEQQIASWLTNYNFDYVRQKTFSDCRYKQILRYDFLVPSNNVLIEYDGKQHYEFVKKFHRTQERFIEFQQRDAIKTEYATLHGYVLHRIKFDEDVTVRLPTIFNV